MKKLFFTGFTLLLPFAITFAIAIFVVHFLTDPFEEGVHTFLFQFESFRQPFLFFSAQQILQLLSRVLILWLLFALLLFIGILGRLVYMRTLFILGDKLLRRLPLIGTVYKPIKEAVHTFLQTKNSLFSQVVLIPFPNPKARSIGLIQTSHKSLIQTASETQLAVFVPSALNPTFGVILFYQVKDLVPLDMSVEEAFKLVVSCGSTLSSLQRTVMET